MAKIDEIIRVNHAGEFGAQQIYRGQMQFLRDEEDIATVREMKEQEDKHFQYFNDAMVKRRVRPTVLHPLWRVAGYTLGAATALMGKKAAMACTVAVEEVIEEHYQEQIEALEKEPSEKELLAKIKQFQQEEIEHKEIGLENEATDAPAYNLLSAAIKKASRAAIWLSKRY